MSKSSKPRIHGKLLIVLAILIVVCRYVACIHSFKQKLVSVSVTLFILLFLVIKFVCS